MVKSLRPCLFIRSSDDVHGIKDRIFLYSPPTKIGKVIHRAISLPVAISRKVLLHVHQLCIFIILIFMALNSCWIEMLFLMIFIFLAYLFTDLGTDFNWGFQQAKQAKI